MELLWGEALLAGTLAQLAITVLFPLLAADLSWGELSPLGWGGMACVLALMVFRGIVTAAVASLFAIQLQEAGLAGAGALKGLVFLNILLTVGIQGFTAPPLPSVWGWCSPSS